jgi:hypothetical protein
MDSLPPPDAKSRIPASGEQEKHGVVTLKPGLYFAALKTVRDRLPVRSDLPLPPRRMVAHRHLKHPGVGLFHPSNMCVRRLVFQPWAIDTQSVIGLEAGRTLP